MSEGRRSSLNRHVTSLMRHVAPDQDVGHAAYVDMADVIRSRRRQLGLSQVELAKAAGVSVRQMARYEAGEQQPVLSAAVDLAAALGITLAQLAGQSPDGIDLTGDWWSGWQTFRDGAELLACQPVRFAQEGDLIQVAATARGLTDEQGGGYLW